MHKWCKGAGLTFRPAVLLPSTKALRQRLFDKGYVDYKWFKSLTDKGVFFVTRVRAKSVYRVAERLPVTPGQGVTSDQRIQFNSAQAMQRGAPELRPVGYREATTGKFYEFLTHNFSLSAKTIAAIYKDRWQVELFFKAIFLFVDFEQAQNGILKSKLLSDGQKTRS